MSRAQSIAVTAIFLVMASPAVSVAAELSYNFPLNATQSYEVDMNAVQTIIEEGDDIPQVASYTQTLGLTNTVLSLPQAGQAEVRTDFDSLAVTLQSDGTSVSYDSVDGTTPPQVLAAMAALVGESYTSVLTDKGAVVSVSGIEELQSNVLASDPTVQIEVDYDVDDFVNGVAGGGAAQLPEGDVVVGATWVSEFTVPNPFTGSLVVTATYTYVEDVVELEYNTAHIEMELTAGNPSRPAPNQGTTIGSSVVETVSSVNLTGSGDLYLAIAEGLLVKQEWTGMLVTRTLATMIGGQQTQSTQVVSEVEISQTMTLTDSVGWPAPAVTPTP